MGSLSITVLSPTARLYSSPKAIVRRSNPRNPNPKRTPKRKKNNRPPLKAKYKPPPQPAPGGEATAYTCLPPLDEDDEGDEFVSRRSILPLEVKLSDFYVAAEKKTPGEGVKSYRVLEEDRPLQDGLYDFAVSAEKKKPDGEADSYRLLEEEEEEEEEEENVGEEDEEAYGRYEVFEVGSDSEDEEEEEEEEDENQEDGGVVAGVGYRVGGVFEAGGLEEEEEDENQEDGGVVAGVGYRVGGVFEAGGLEDFDFDSDEDDNLEEGEVVEGVGYRVGEVFEAGGVEEIEGGSEEEEEIERGNGVIMGDKIGERRNWEEEEEGEEANGEDKDKGLPAVMRCFDRAKIFVKGGNGGNGVVAFRREKFVPLGGPSGGDGGRGGNVYMEVDTAMNSLLPFRSQVHFRAGRGSHGQGSQMGGAKGEDVIIKVAPGTVVREAGKEDVLLELVRPGQRALLLNGGRGGRGNASFKSSGNKAPRIAENGEEGPELWLDLELKLVADVGIVGAPNAGKSTLLSVICAAQPAIANYPFTTLLPNLGVVSFDYDSTMVVADLPGLLEGAHRGFGLGHEFLRHSERCSALVHVVDGSSEQPELEFDAVRLEIELFSPELEEKPYVVAFNKMDLPDVYEKWSSFKENLEARGIKTFCMSAVKREGTHDVICAAYELIRKSKEAMEGIEDVVGLTDSEDLNHVADMVKQKRKTPIDDFEISYDKTSMAWHVNGAGLQRFVQMTNWRYVDSDKRFQNVLEACGVTKSLKKMGVKEGDTVLVGEMELVWHDSPGTPSKMKKRSESTKWSDWKP